MEENLSSKIYNQQDVLSIEGAVWLDGFSLRGRVHLLLQIIMEVITILDAKYPFLKRTLINVTISCKATAHSVSSNFKPMGLGIECLLTFYDNSKKRILLHVDKGDYQSKEFVINSGIDKFVKNISLTGYHRGASASGF